MRISGIERRIFKMIKFLNNSLCVLKLISDLRHVVQLWIQVIKAANWFMFDSNFFLLWIVSYWGIRVEYKIKFKQTLRLKLVTIKLFPNLIWNSNPFLIVPCHHWWSLTAHNLSRLTLNVIVLFDLHRHRIFFCLMS